MIRSKATDLLGYIWLKVEEKINCNLFEMLFKIKKNGIFPFGISLRFRDINVFALCK